MVLVFLPLFAVQRFQNKISNHIGSFHHKGEAAPLISNTWLAFASFPLANHVHLR